jgi:hypothetical protein
MHEPILNSARDTFLVALPFAAVLFLGFFRSDQILAAAKRRTGSRRAFCVTVENGIMYLTDPDGRPWQRMEGLKLLEGFVISKASPPPVSSRRIKGQSPRSMVYY